MTSILFALAVVALVVYGLERNHHRQVRLGSRPGNRLAGSSDVEDRDASRLQADLRALPHPAGSDATGPVPPVPTRSAPARSAPARSAPARFHGTSEGIAPNLAPTGAVPDRPVSPRRSDQPCLAR